MNEDTRSHLSNEVSLGRKAEVAYEGFIKPFIMSKRKDLFNNFCDTSMMDVDVILESKRLVKVIDQLEEEILTLITTGKLAEKSLGE